VPESHQSSDRESHKEIQRQKKQYIDHPVWELPTTLKTDNFAEAWIDWYRHRLEINTPLTQTAGEFQLKELEEIGESRAIAAIRHSIMRGWKSIFEPNGNGSHSNGNDVKQNSDGSYNV
jgi:hypothetical protein